MSNMTRRAMLGTLAALTLSFRARAAYTRQVSRDLSHLSPEQRTTFETMYARMMAALPYERRTVTGTNAWKEWKRLRGGPLYPVIIGGDEDLERIAEQYSIDDSAVFGGGTTTPPRTPAQILAAADELRFPKDLAAWPGAYQEGDLHAPVGDWPAERNSPDDVGLTVATDLMTGKMLDRVHMLLVPARHGWEVPAYLRWGNWNACPPPEYHVAALRSWHERYGADLVAINGDTMNLHAARPPADHGTALTLARDQYRYCPDIVDQGAGTLAGLAAALMRSPWWYFWWD